MLSKDSVQVCCHCVAQSYLTLCDPVDCSTPGSPGLDHLLGFAQTHIHWVDDATKYIILCHPFSCPQFSHWVFSSESALSITWPKYWSFSFSVSPSNEYLGLISFRMDWFGLLAVQGSLKCLLQHHSSNASILWQSAFFMVQLSHWYMTTGKNHSFDYMDLCRQSNVSAF